MPCMRLHRSQLMPKELESMKEVIYLNMSAYFLLALETLASISWTTFPKAFIMCFSATNVVRCDMHRQIITSAEIK